MKYTYFHRNCLKKNKTSWRRFLGVGRVTGDKQIFFKPKSISFQDLHDPRGDFFQNLLLTFIGHMCRLLG